jgi:hypothetical protein
MAYALLVIKDKPIPILSLRRKNVVNNEFTSKDLVTLLRINKQINTEASALFYSRNTWVTGNGKWGSRRAVNGHALRAFISRVPKRNIAQIKNVIFEIHARESIPHPPMLNNRADAANLLLISRILIKHFLHLEILEFQINVVDGQLPFDGMLYQPLSKDEHLLELTKMLEILLKAKRLREVITPPDQGDIQIQTAANKLLLEHPEYVGRLEAKD